MSAREQAEVALQRFNLGTPRLTPIDVGLINITFRVDTEAGSQYALQRLNPIFGARVHEDIEAVTAHIAAKGLQTPRLHRTADGALWTEVEGGVWRILSWIDGENVSQADSPRRTEAAGELLGRFHAAVQDLEHSFVNARLGVHDTAQHLQNLRDALKQHKQHRLYEQIAPLAQDILQSAAALGPLPTMADRVVHGDPKLNNLVFDPGNGQGRCLIDLDTLARMPIALELGDAMRSWCNPSGESANPPRFDLSMFEGALQGYARGSAGLLTEQEWRSIVPATLTIILELAARFAADALNECYFGWDSKRFESRGAHNLLRAEVQFGLASALMNQREAAQAIVDANRA